MATTLFFRHVAADIQRLTNTAKLNGVTAGWSPMALKSTRGDGINVRDTPTVAGATNGVEVDENGGTTEPKEWISDPIAADVTISGNINANLWVAESSMNANCSINIAVDVIRATDLSIVTIGKSAQSVEMAITTRAVQSPGFTPGAGVLVNRGDRLRVRVFADDAGTMGSGFTFAFGYDAASASVDGDSWVQFTETITFETVTTPGGSVIYLTDTASDVATASVDREAWTSRGAGVQTDVTNTATGWTAGIQVTDTAGGTVVDWFTKQLAAFTLGGLASANVRAAESNASANAAVRAEIARVNSDGTSPTVWSTAGYVYDGAAGELSTSEAAYTFWLAGDDLAISDTQRLRFRLYLEDSSEAALVTGFTMTIWYAGTSGGASGDTFFTLPQTLTEFTPPDPNVAVFRVPPIIKAPEALRTQRRWA